MLQRYAFIAVCIGMLSGLGIWSAHIELRRAQSRSPAENWSAANRQSLSTLEAGIGSPVRTMVQQRELLETLDKIVSYQHYYRSVYGHFTKILSRTGASIPKAISSIYEIRVSEATTDRLLISAFSEVAGKSVDQVTIDDDYVIKASFPLPPPRPEYMRLQAAKFLRALLEAPEGQVPSESGVFKGYFKYELRRDSENQKIAFAVGIRPPVLGAQLEVGGASKMTVAELDPHFVLNGEIEEFAQMGTLRTGQRSDFQNNAKEEAYLAQRIFHGEIGRYAQNWSELSRIANFQFEEQEMESAPIREGVQRGIASGTVVPQSDSIPRNLKKKLSSPAVSGRLEIEPVLADE